jgi:hypothetical protein
MMSANGHNPNGVHGEVEGVLTVAGAGRATRAAATTVATAGFDSSTSGALGAVVNACAFNCFHRLQAQVLQRKKVHTRQTLLNRDISVSLCRFCG